MADSAFDTSGQTAQPFPISGRPDDELNSLFSESILRQKVKATKGEGGILVGST